MTKKVVEFARSQLGVSEQPPGSNKGAEVDKYLECVGITFPAAWCAAFVVYSHLQVGVTDIPKTGGVLDLWNKSPEHRVSKPEPGDVVIFDYGGGKGHTGIVEAVDGDTLTTIVRDEQKAERQALANKQEADRQVDRAQKEVAGSVLALEVSQANLAAKKQKQAEADAALQQVLNPGPTPVTK